MALCMYRFSLVLALLLGLLLPSFGSVAMAGHCPMQKSMADMHHAGHASPCCAEQGDGAGDKPSCDFGQQCQTGGLLVTPAIKLFAPLSALPQAFLSQPLTQRQPAGLWRPPPRLLIG